MTELTASIEFGPTGGGCFVGQCALCWRLWRLPRAPRTGEQSSLLLPDGHWFRGRGPCSFPAWFATTRRSPWGVSRALDSHARSSRRGTRRSWRHARRCRSCVGASRGQEHSRGSAGLPCAKGGVPPSRVRCRVMAGGSCGPRHLARRGPHLTWVHDAGPRMPHDFRTRCRGSPCTDGPRCTSRGMCPSGARVALPRAARVVAYSARRDGEDGEVFSEAAKAS